MPPAFNDLSEAQTARTTGRGMMGFAFSTASLGTIPFFSLFLTSFTSHHVAKYAVASIWCLDASRWRSWPLS